MRHDARVAAALIVIMSTALLLRVRGENETVPNRDRFSFFPHQLGEWKGIDAAIPSDSLAVLGRGDFLLRRYQTPHPDAAPVDLFLAYYASQRAGDTMHSPKHCLPGEGWLPMESRQIALKFPGRESFQANRYLIAKSGQRALVIYWYQSRDRALAGEYEARFYLIADSIRLNRSDGSLIRASTILSPKENTAAAEQRLLSLLTAVVPMLGNYIPL